MTRPELNTSIDTVFSDSIADASLTPSMEGIQLKKVADYTDQEVAVISSSLGNKVDKVTGKSLILDTEITRLSTVTTVDVSGKENTSNKSINITTDATSDVKYPSVKAVKTYVDAHPTPLYYNSRYAQSGTNAPSAQVTYSNTLLVGNYTMGDNYRDIKISRIDVGTYYFDIVYKSIATNPQKAMLMCGSGQCQVSGTLTGIVSGESYIRWVVETRNSTGTLADGQMNGNIPITITLYP